MRPGYEVFYQLIERGHFEKEWFGLRLLLQVTNADELNPERWSPTWAEVSGLSQYRMGPHAYPVIKLRAMPLDEYGRPYAGEEARAAVLTLREKLSAQLYEYADLIEAAHKLGTPAPEPTPLFVGMLDDRRYYLRGFGAMEFGGTTLDLEVAFYE